MSQFMNYHWRAPPHKYDIIYMEKVLSYFFYLLDVVLNLWNSFSSQDISGLVSVPFPPSVPHLMVRWLTWPTVAPAEEWKKDHDKSEHDKAEMKWKTIHLFCGLDLPAYNSTSFLSSLRTSVCTAEIGYVCVRAAELHQLNSGLCCSCGGDMAHFFGSLDVSKRVLVKAKWHWQSGYSTRSLKIWPTKDHHANFWLNHYKPSL